MWRRVSSVIKLVSRFVRMGCACSAARATSVAASNTTGTTMEAMMSTSITTPKSNPACRYCGCTEDRACRIRIPWSHYATISCRWVNEEKDLCSNPACIDRWFAERAAEEATHAAQEQVGVDKGLQL
jgi:hypothetical protein